MLVADDFESYKRKVEEVVKEANRAQGACDQLAKQIRKKFGCKTAKEARKLHAKLQKQEIQANHAYTKAREQFEKRWGERLESIRQ